MSKKKVIVSNIIQNNKRALGLTAFILILSFICITISSKFSFLYAFHEVDDVHCFITTARCMLRGDVLYRDVYEHKGPMHYFFYCLGIALTKGSFTGIWILEVFLFALFLLFVYKTIILFIKSPVLSVVITTSIGIWATVSESFCGGGECEELTLPFISAAVYYALQLYNGNDNDEAGERHNGDALIILYSGIIGFCFSVVFWSKYTITGAFAGYVVAVIIIGIIQKDILFILKRAFGFAIGTLLGSAPVILYFAINGAFRDLWEVYFYNLIFRYSQIEKGGTSFFDNLKSMFSLIMIIAGAGTASAPKSLLKPQGRIIALCMLSFDLVGLAAGKIWGYVYEARAGFYVFFFVGIIGFWGRLNTIKWISEKAENKREKMRNWVTKEMERTPKLSAAINTLFYSKKKLTFSVGAILLLIYSLYFSYTVTPYSYAIGADSDAYAIIRVSERIKQLELNNPNIICFTSLDPGLYYLTGTYPPDKYFCSYNLYTPKELGFYEKYIATGEADCVISYLPVESLEKYGYSLYYAEENATVVDCEMTMGMKSFYLYARNDLFRKERSRVTHPAFLGVCAQ